MASIFKIAIIFSMIIIQGCALLLPYSENFACKVPEGKGYCGSVSDGYEYSVNRSK